LFRFPLTAMAAIAVVAVGAGAALAGTTNSAKLVAFTATYAGTANVTVADGASTIQASGAGKGTLIGVSKVTGTGGGSADSSATCQVWKGTGILSGLKGKIYFTIASAQACGDQSGDAFSLVGRATVTKGTGIFKRSKGSKLKVTGLYTKSAKSFQVKFNGKLTV
jgi:hypothetical protein